MDLTPEQREALRPLAAVIEGAITESPIRLGTNDWGTVLAATVLARVAAYMGGIVPTPAADPSNHEEREHAGRNAGLTIPAQASADDEHALRFLRRESLLVLLSRLQRGRALSEAEADTLRHHVETEISEAETARSVAAGNKRHVQVMYAELAAAQASIERVRALADQWDNALAPARSQYSGPVRAALDGTEQALRYETCRTCGAIVQPLGMVLHMREQHPDPDDEDPAAPETCTATIPGSHGSAVLHHCVAPAGHYDESKPPVFSGENYGPRGWHTDGNGHVWADWAEDATPHGAEPTSEA